MMQYSTIRNSLVSAIVLTSFTLLTACHTVEGTVQGAGQDVQAVANTVSPAPQPTQPPHHRMHHHKKHHHKKMMNNTSNTSDEKTSNQSTEQSDTNKPS